MIIDTHVHIGKVLKFNMTREDVLYSIDKYGIDFSLVSNIDGVECFPNGIKIPKFLLKSQNRIFRETIEFAKSNPDKIGAMPWLKPLTEKIDDEFIKLLDDNKKYVYGMKIHPFQSRVSPDDKRLELAYDIAKNYKLPVVSHTGGCKEADSERLYNAAKKHPDVDFVMVHMDLGTDNKKALDLLGKLPNLYGDTTWVPVKITLEAIKRYGSEKIVFGSDSPIDGKDTYLHNKYGQRSLYQEYFNEFRDMVSESDYENIMYKNAVRIFKIKL